MKKYCYNCGKIFFEKGLYCSGWCMKKYNDIFKRTFAVRKCGACGKSFTPDVFNQKYCDKKCGKVALKKMQEKIKEHTVFHIFKRDNFKCLYCGRSSIEDGVRLHVDHITPKHLGGERNIDNVATACETCNLQKHTSLLTTGQLIRFKALVKKRNRKNNIRRFRI